MMFIDDFIDCQYAMALVGWDVEDFCGSVQDRI